MEIKTSKFGSLDADNETVINFPNGIPGFEKCTKYKIFHDKDKEVKGEQPCFWLQSIDDPELSFQTIDAAALGLNYEFTLTDEETNLLKLEETDDIAVLLLTSKNDNPQKGESNIKVHMTTPLAINLKSAIGLQKILRNEEYDLNYNVKT
ncbi:MAG: flagellar assembly protein FliW [Candidatus Anammoxibacter sp.]